VTSDAESVTSLGEIVTTRLALEIRGFGLFD